MSGIKNQLRRIKFKLTHDYFAVENMVLLLAIILGGVWTFQSIQAMTRNWELTERLAKENRELALLKIEVETAELENEYYKTDEYQELMARKLLDKQSQGEKMVAMPENSEDAKMKHNETMADNTAREYSNFEKWLRFLFP